MSQLKQFSITIRNPEVLDFRKLGLTLHGMKGLVYWWLCDTELTLVFEKAYAESGVIACHNLVNGSLPSITP